MLINLIKLSRFLGSKLLTNLCQATGDFYILVFYQLEWRNGEWIKGINNIRKRDIGEGGDWTNVGVGWLRGWYNWMGRIGSTYWGCSGATITYGEGYVIWHLPFNGAPLNLTPNSPISSLFRIRNSYPPQFARRLSYVNRWRFYLECSDLPSSSVCIKPYPTVGIHPHYPYTPFVK